MNDADLLRLRDLLTSEAALVAEFRAAFERGGRDAVLAHLADVEPLKALGLGDALRLANALSVHPLVDVAGAEAADRARRADVAAWCTEARAAGLWDGE